MSSGHKPNKYKKTTVKQPLISDLPLFWLVQLKSLKVLNILQFPFIIFPSWLSCWYFTLLGNGREDRGLLDKHPTLSRSSKHHCYCYCLMPCNSIVVLQQSTHTYVIKLRGSGTIQAIVTPNSDQYKGPNQSRLKLTLCITVFQDWN